MNQESQSVIKKYNESQVVKTIASAIDFSTDWESFDCIHWNEPR